MVGVPETNRSFSHSPLCTEMKGRGTDDLHRHGGVCRAELLALPLLGEKEHSQEPTRLSPRSGTWHTLQVWLWSCHTSLELCLSQRRLELTRAVWKSCAGWQGDKLQWCGTVPPNGVHRHHDEIRVHKWCFHKSRTSRERVPQPLACS